MKKFDYAIVKNPMISQENRLPIYSDHECMPSWFEGEYNSFRMSLDGLWKFSYAKDMDLAVVDFEKEEYSCKGWDEIQVPDTIQIEHVFSGEIPTEFNPVASYVKYFTVPVNMRGERMCISFQGVEGGFAVWLNGQYVGYSENAYAPAEFELTPYLKEGENKLAVRVWKWTAGSGDENQDCGCSFGIIQNVYLYVVPRTHLWDIQIVPELSEDLSEATLTIITTSCGKGEVEIRLLDDSMQEVLAGVMVLEEGEEGSDEIQSGIAGMVYQPKLWSAEEPNLYMLQLEVRDEFGDLTEVTSQYVGFRRFERKDGSMTLNGKPISFWGIDGAIKDIAMMKQNNINVVRASQYPSDSSYYDLCDEYGLYMIADREDSCHQRYKNHPSMIWEDVELSLASSSNMQETKYSYQNISVEFTDKTFTVWNKNSFINTDAYNAFVILQKDGKSIAKVALPISVAPLEKKAFDIPQQLLDIMDNLKIASAVHEGEIPEFAITVSFALPTDNAWAKRGHEVAFGQYVYKKEVLPYTCKEPLEVRKNRDDIIVKGQHFKAIFSCLDAGLVSYVYGGVEMFKRMPLPNFWRAPKNDSAGVHMQKNYAQWKIASMYISGKQPEEDREMLPVVEKLEDSVKLTYTYYMPTNPTSSCQVCYHVFGDGTIETTLEYEPVEGLCDMPEFGMMFQLDADFDNLSWYGLESEGGKLGVYQNKVADNMAKHQIPQECGRKCGVRYAEITNGKGRGMRFFGDELCFSALPYTPHELENATNICELPEVHNTIVRVAQSEYLLDVSKKKVFTFCFCGV